MTTPTELTVELVLIFVILFLLICLILLLFAILFWGEKIKNFFSRLKITKRKSEGDINEIIDFFNKLSSTLLKLSSDKVGALIIIENKDSLQPYINIGNKIDVEFFPEFVVNIFYNHKSPLHDGAMIIKDWRIVSLSSYLPMTRKIVNVEYGARHRAAFGICERFDCFAFVVSETNGNITLVHQDQFKRLSNAPEKINVEIASLFASCGVFKSLKKLKKTNIVEEMKDYNNSAKIK